MGAVHDRRARAIVSDGQMHLAQIDARDVAHLDERCGLDDVRRAQLILCPVPAHLDLHGDVECPRHDERSVALAVRQPQQPVSHADGRALPDDPVEAWAAMRRVGVGIVQAPRTPTVERCEEGLDDGV